MQVNGRIFYHILTAKYYANKWKPGKTFKYQDKNNHLIRLRILEQADRIKDIKGDKPYLVENFKIIENAKKVIKGEGGGFLDIFDFIAGSREQLSILIKRVTELHNVTFSYVNLFNEIIFEQARKNDFPNLPSRMGCAYLCNKQQVKKWLREFEIREYSRVFKVAAYGEVIKVDRAWLPTDIASVNDVFDAADHYWKGEITKKSRSRLIEYLLQGKLKVVEEVTSEFVK